MGITSSTDLKSENSDSKSQKAHVQSEKVGDSSRVLQDLHVFMREGACKKTYMAVLDCIKKNKKENNYLIKSLCYPMLEKCMEAHSDYYHPFLSAKKKGVKLLMKVFLPPTVWRDPFDYVSPNQLKEEEEEAERFSEYMRGGGCKEPFKAWKDCTDEANNKEDIVNKCVGVFLKMNKCMDAHSEYYHPLLVAKKTAQEFSNQAFYRRSKLRDD